MCTEDPARRIAAECFGVRLRSLTRTATRVYDEELRGHDLNLAQCNLLAAIGVAGPVPPGALAQGLSMDKSTMSRVVRRLADRGLVAVYAAQEGRGQLLALTARGRSTLAAAEPDWARAQDRVRDILGDTLADALVGAPRRLTAPAKD